MKFYKEEGQLVIDGENAFTIQNQCDYGFFMSEDVTNEKMKICNFHLYGLQSGIIKKIKLLYKVIKYIFFNKMNQNNKEIN